jgi:excisionase family DNA binding protein
MERTSKKKQGTLADRVEKARTIDGGAAVLLTVDEAAARLRIGRVKCYELMGQGKLAFVMIGRARRVTAASLDAFVQSAST